MINKTADEASAILLLICSHEVWVRVTYDWSKALRLCLALCLILLLAKLQLGKFVLQPVLLYT